ncbi:hypothetical protein VULLAG_LOCUS18762 [Vulpes lagopus]
MFFPDRCRSGAVYKVGFGGSVGIPGRGGSAPQIGVRQGAWKEEWELGRGGWWRREDARRGWKRGLKRATRRGQGTGAYPGRRDPDLAGLGGSPGPGDSS